jgi:hypothetical protein
MGVISLLKTSALPPTMHLSSFAPNHSFDRFGRQQRESYYLQKSS